MRVKAVGPNGGRHSSPDGPSAVIVVSDYANVNGGNSAVALTSAVALAESGVRTIVFAAAGPIARELQGVAGLEVVCLNVPDFLGDSLRMRGAVRGLWDLKAAREIKRILTSCDPLKTVVHVHSWTKALSASVIAAARDAGFRIVVTLHDYFAFCPNGSLYDHDKQAACPLVPMSSSCIAANCDPRSRAQKMYRVVRQSISAGLAGMPKGINYYISVSAYSRRVATPFLGESVIFDVRNPIEVEKGPPVDVRASDEFVYVGRFSPEKGADIFAMAVRLSDAAAVFVGDGPMRDATQYIAPAASFTGWLDRKAVTAHLRRARALVLPSRWHEASPLVVPEAAALGVPAIVSDGCAAIDEIVDGVTGLKFRNGDVVHLAEKLKALTPELAGVMGRAAYDRFWTDPPLMSKHVAALHDVYAEVLA